ncbi:hypothetical protein T492DRAFT_870016 [Pavlovales sp. CCMP2436]|nr:hypothetical protein T492DRAFT_870016 [Pavlovales sp. CCMP2436]
MAVLKLLSFLVVIVAILVGSLIAGVPTKMGVWRWVATNVETKLVGMAPAFMSAEHYEYSFEQLRRLDLTGQNAIVTGANVGLGYATSLHLARQGAHVILACRNKGKCANAAASIRANFTAAAVEALVLDTSSLKSVREFVAQVPLALVRLGGSLDMLVLNAGIGILPEAQISVDGIELMFATNHVGHQLLYSLLLPLMDSGGKAGVSRVALVSSQLNSAPVSAKGYGQSKLAQSNLNLQFEPKKL